MTSSPRQWLRLLAGVAALAAAVPLAIGGGTRAAAADDPQLSALRTTSSAVTAGGTGPFAGLEVTVGQTRNLVNQAILVTWKGAVPTLPSTDRFAANYLQVMQCWGDDAAGPRRDQCAFGARAATDDRGGDFAATRQIGGTGIVDPLEDPKLFQGDTPRFVPFVSVNGTTAQPGNTNEFFDGNTTNEISYARTNENGTGSMVVEAQTANQDAGLGCGDVVAGKSHRCWLVVVPRSAREVDGTVKATNGGNGGGREAMVSSSPLSLTNWQHRIVVPLQFSPLAGGCALGTAERRTLGDELATEAMLRWQPGLCESGTVYGYSQVVSATANRKLVSPSPGLVFVTSPPEAAPDKPAVYAPVAVSALGIGLAVDTQLPASPTKDVAALDGTQVSDMRLSQRVVAKLLTQSYQTAVPSGGRYLTANPRDLTTDPDFLADNPRFTKLRYDRITDVMVPGATTRDYQAIWAWVLSDPAAQRFLAGYPDPWGARVSPFYQGSTTATDSFPRLDPYCQRFGPPVTGYAQQTPLCALDAFPYTNDMHDGARSSSRGDSLARTRWNLALRNSDTPPGYKKAPVQLPGRRSLLALVDSATAARFGIPMASLRNASGTFVAPTSTSVAAGVAAMGRDTTTGVRSLAPTAARGAAYPLASVTYAATVPSALTQQEAREYGKLIRYAAGPGQTPGSEPGTLPAGYVPLSQGLRAEAVAVAGAVERRVGVVDLAPTDQVPGGQLPDIPSLPGADTPVGSSPQGLGPVPSAVTPQGVPTITEPTGVGRLQPVAAQRPAQVPTPGLSVGLVRYVLVAGLIVGGLSLISAPTLPWVARRLTRSTG